MIIFREPRRDNGMGEGRGGAKSNVGVTNFIFRKIQIRKKVYDWFEPTLNP